MDQRARLTSKGQVTIPKRVRLALGRPREDALVFRDRGARGAVARQDPATSSSSPGSARLRPTSAAPPGTTSFGARALNVRSRH